MSMSFDDMYWFIVLTSNNMIYSTKVVVYKKTYELTLSLINGFIVSML